MPKYYRKRDGSYTNYRVVSSTPDDAGKVSYGEMSVRNTPRGYISHWEDKEPVSNPMWKKVAKDTGLSFQFLNHLYKTSDSVAESIDTAINAKNNTTKLGRPARLGPGEQRHIWNESMAAIKSHPDANPETLFTDIEPTTVIHSAGVDKGMRHTFPTMVSIAQQDNSGKKVVPSTNLSIHSAKIAQNASKKGLISGGKEHRVRNPIDFSSHKATPEDMDYSLKSHGFQEIPELEVSLARESLRETLRGPRKSPPSVSPAQFDHPRLFED